MRILIIADEEWNDFVFANNVLTNWFKGFDADFAEIYASPGLPCNTICKRYFQISDAEMAKSILGFSKSGHVVDLPYGAVETEQAKVNAQRQGIYAVMKNISLRFNTIIQLLHDFIWLNGRYDKKAMWEFINGFKPDVVFCPRMITPKLMRLERLVSTMTNAPFVAFTGDNEASENSINRFSLSGQRRRYIHKKFKEHVKIYSCYMMHSQDQAEEYFREYGVPTSTLFKCGDFPATFVKKEPNSPIRMVYAGRLYCNRWKSLAEIGAALRIINREQVKMVLDIYTQESLTSEQSDSLSEDKYVYIKGSVSPKELADIYKDADIALHVESLDDKYKYVTRVSFSTKIIDLMASSCAVMAICWDQHAGYQYLKENDAAFCVDSYDKILPQLQRIVENPEVINAYAKKAYECGKKNHSRDKIQSQLKSTFEKYINR